MGLIDTYEDLLLDAEKEGKKEIFLRAAAVALQIAHRKTSKRRASHWTEEAVRCIASADPEAAEEEFQGLLQYSPWRALDEVTELFERKYFCIDEVHH